MFAVTGPGIDPVFAVTGPGIDPRAMTSLADSDALKRYDNRPLPRFQHFILPAHTVNLVEFPVLTSC